MANDAENKNIYLKQGMKLLRYLQCQIDQHMNHRSTDNMLSFSVGEVKPEKLNFIYDGRSDSIHRGNKRLLSFARELCARYMLNPSAHRVEYTLGLAATPVCIGAVSADTLRPLILREGEWLYLAYYMRDIKRAFEHGIFNTSEGYVSVEQYILDYGFPLKDSDSIPCNEFNRAFRKCNPAIRAEFQDEHRAYFGWVIRDRYVSVFRFNVVTGILEYKSDSPFRNGGKYGPIPIGADLSDERMIEVILNHSGAFAANLSCWPGSIAFYDATSAFTLCISIGLDE